MDSQSSKCIEGIVCEVSSCKYHTTQDECMAGKIEVGDQSATDKSDTLCRTFKADM